jgi:hypothetical protein
MASFRIVTDDEIERGLDLVAELIDRYGDVYWPVFDRLESELAQRRLKEARLKARLRRGKTTYSGCHK